MLKGRGGASPDWPLLYTGLLKFQKVRTARNCRASGEPQTRDSLDLQCAAWNVPAHGKPDTKTNISFTSAWAMV